MFEKAVRMKLRFAHKGVLTVEDLWDLPLDQLDALYGKLRAEQKAANDDSLLRKETESGRVRDLKIDIVKHVVAVKLQEDEARKMRAENKLRKDRIAEVIERKQDDELSKMSIGDLRKEMETLG
jgi:hypothetical protein